MQNPIEDLRRLMMYQGISSAGRSLSSFDIYDRNLSDGSVNLLFEQLKAYVFGVDLFKSIDEDVFAESDIK